MALEGTLDLVHSYTIVPVGERTHVPWEYDHNAESPETNPRIAEGSRVRETPEDDLKCWAFWVPPPCPPDPKKAETGTAEPRGPSSPARMTLAQVWVANEVGRSLVRAVEFATTSKALLDRDRSRVLLSLEKAARRFADPPDSRPSDVGSAGVVVAYLVELGIGVRRCPPDELEWHFEPLTRLAVLHRDFNKKQMDEVLVIGTAAGVLKVAEAITAARSREQISRLHRPNQHLQERIRHDAVVRTVNDLRNVEELRAPNENKTFTLFDPCDGAPVRRQKSTDLALKVAESLFLEPREQSVIHPTDKGLLKELHTELLCTSKTSQDQQKQEPPA